MRTRRVRKRRELVGAVVVLCGGTDEVDEDASSSSHVEGRGEGEALSPLDERWVRTTQGVVVVVVVVVCGGATRGRGAVAVGGVDR